MKDHIAHCVTFGFSFFFPFFFFFFPFTQSCFLSLFLQIMDISEAQIEKKGQTIGNNVLKENLVNGFSEVLL